MKLTKPNAWERSNGMFSDYVSAYKLLNDVSNLSRSKAYEEPTIEQQFELGIAFPCKVDNFSGEIEKHDGLYQSFSDRNGKRCRKWRRWCYC